MTEQMDNVEFLQKCQEIRHEGKALYAFPDAFARCAEKIEAARKAKAVPADVAGLVKRLRAYSSADHRASVCDEAARFLESMTPPVDGALTEKTAIKNTQQLAEMGGKQYLRWIAANNLRQTDKNFQAFIAGYTICDSDKQSAPTPPPQDDAALREVAQDIVKMATERDSVTSELAFAADAQP